MKKTHWQLAQINIAHMIAPIDDPRLADFVAQLDGVNQLADRSPGFVWRLQTDEGNAADIRIDADPSILVNMSVWQSLADLRTFVSSSLHLSIMRRRAEWFEKMDEATMVLWWVADAHHPDFEEAMERLSHLRRHGPRSYAFSFSKPFDA